MWIRPLRSLIVTDGQPVSPPNDQAHRPPSPDLSKLQNSKASVPNANGGSVQRPCSAACSVHHNNLRPGGPGARRPPAQALFLLDRRGLRTIDQTLHLFSWQNSSEGNGR